MPKSTAGEGWLLLLLLLLGLLLLLLLLLGLQLLRAGQGQRAGLGVGALCYLHLVKVGLQLGLLLQEQPLLVQPAARTEKELFLHHSHSSKHTGKSPGNPAH